MTIKVTVNKLLQKQIVWPLKYSRKSILKKEKSKSKKLRLVFTNLLPIYNHFFILLAQPSIEDLHILNRQVVFK